MKEPARVSGVCIEIDHDLVHAAEFGVQHALDLAGIEGCKDVFRPFRELDLDFQGCLISSEAEGIPQAGIGLMQSVPGRP